MGKLEIKNRSGYKKIVFMDEKVILYKKDSEIEIPIESIDCITYENPSVFNIVFNMINGGPMVGSFVIQLNKKIKDKSAYLLRIKSKEKWQLPKFYRLKIGLDTLSDPD